MTVPAAGQAGAAPPPSVVSAERAVARVDALRAAVEAGQGRLDPDQLAAGADAADRVRERLRLSATHTIVALAGATGSGKSSVFNALTGLDLAAVGVKRPTTSWTTACAWDADGAADLLGWLGVPARNQVSRLSMLDVSPEDTELQGLVLLDLPDHDSTEVAHHLEVDRLVRFADLVVWVLDPQKYADAALHERYLRPYSTHADVMLAVLNQVDRLTAAERADAVADVHRLLKADGLGDVPVLATSTVCGEGLAELRQVLIGRLQAKEAARARVTSDVTAAALRLADHGGTEPMAGSDEGIRADARERLVDAVAGAAGLDAAPGPDADQAARRGQRAAGWPPFAMFSTGTEDPGTRTVTVDRSQVDAAVADFVEEMAAGAALPWLDAVRAATADASTGLAKQVADVSRSVIAATAPPLWARVLGVLQALLVLTVIVAVGWQLDRHAR